MKESKDLQVQTSVYIKMQKISNEIRNLEKDMMVGSGSYAYKAISDTMVTLAVKDAETKHGIMSVPIKQEVLSSEVIRIVNDRNQEKITYVENIKMTLRVVDLETGDYIDIESLGKGIDSSDKGFGKASTYARKHGLLNAYKIATGEDPDAEKSTDSISLPTVEENHKKVLDFLNLDLKVRNNTLSHFSVSELSDLTKDQLTTIYSTFTKKKLI